jgi:polyhydroxybutyrate depolymerase
MKRLLLTLLTVVLTAAAAGAQPFAPGETTRTLVSGGLTRSYILHVPPSYTGGSPVPLVLDFHGLSATAAIQAGLSGFRARSDTFGFVVVWPQGVNNAWNGGICCAANGPDDVAFVRELVAQLKLDGNIDASRVYVTGLSNGGAMTHRLACEAADVFAAAAPLAFPISVSPPQSCNPARPIPVLTFMGLTDALVPYNGGPFPSAQATLDHWRSTNFCGTGAFEEHIENGASYCDTDTSCAGGVSVGLCSITAQAFPGQFYDGHILYLNPDYDLSALAWAFMAQFTLPEPEPPAVPALPGVWLPSAAALLGALGARRLRQLRA